MCWRPGKNTTALCCRTDRNGHCGTDTSPTQTETRVCVNFVCVHVCACVCVCMFLRGDDWSLARKPAPRQRKVQSSTLSLELVQTTHAIDTCCFFSIVLCSSTFCALPLFIAHRCCIVTGPVHAYSHSFIRTQSPPAMFMRQTTSENSEINSS